MAGATTSRAACIAMGASNSGWINILLASAFLPLCAMAALNGHAEASPRTCFPDVHTFMAATWGAQFEDDDNLHVDSVMYGKVNFSRVTDTTTGTNSVTFLLRTNARRDMCVVLATSPSAQLELVKVNTAGVPQTFRTVDQAPPGYAENEIFYQLDDTMRYVAAVCNKLAWNGKRRIRKRSACNAQ